MDLSPDGKTVVSASADETIRFWEIFPGADFKSGSSATGKSSPIRNCLSSGLSMR
jgi:WD40 repeat protein